jgi:hypothetical protein
MPIDELMYRDRDGVTYKHPERSCKRCLKYPCLPNMDSLYCDFAKYGCKHWSDLNTFD